MEAETNIETAGAMDQSTDNAHVVIRPPIALALAVAAGLAATWLYPLPFVPAAPVRWAGFQSYGDWR